MSCPPAKHNSNGLVLEIDKMVVVQPPEKEDNSTTERKDNSAIEIEDNSSVQQEKGAEPSQPGDAISSPVSHGEEEQTVSTHLQRNKHPPAWLGDFITGGELDQSFSNDTTTRTLAVHTTDMHRNS